MHIKYYVRYMDDGILIHESKEVLNRTRRQMEVMARDLKLEFNSKTQVFPISQGVDFPALLQGKTNGPGTEDRQMAEKRILTDRITDGLY